MRGGHHRRRASDGGHLTAYSKTALEAAIRDSRVERAWRAPPHPSRDVRFEDRSGWDPGEPGPREEVLEESYFFSASFFTAFFTAFASAAIVTLVAVIAPAASV
jgi:hypothetical protein